MTRATELWSACADRLRDQVSDAVWQSTFAEVRALSVEGQHLLIAVPSGFVRDRIEGPFRQLVLAALHGGAGPDIELLVEVQPDAASSELTIFDDELQPNFAHPTGGGADPDIEHSSGGRPQWSPDQPLSPTARPARDNEGDRLNPDYTFENFVIGSSNRFAHAAALSVAEMPARSYNPLFIYGAAGLGKTHLLHGVGHYVRTVYPKHRVRYVSTETFLNDFIESIRTNTGPDFKRRYREVDVLLVDDIQFIEGKERFQEEFFHTFNALHGAGHQIVITSDRPPASFATLEARLRTRFNWGLLTDIQPPDLETRLAILRTKAETTPMPPDVLEFIATNFRDNIRELEGAFIKLAAFSSLNNELPTVEMADKVLSDMLAHARPRPITPKLILETTAEMFGFSVEDLQSRSRKKPLVTARQVAMYVFRQLTDMSYPSIAQHFGGRDHTTVIHAVEKITALMGERQQIYDQVSDLMARINSGG